jgi:c-di-GMP-binding flagellar brake protein YcgR
VKAEEKNKLEALLLQYNALTLNLIELLENDDFDSLERVFDLRQKVISNIDNIEFDSIDFKNVCKEVDLLPLQQRLTIIINKKKAMLKNEINNLEVTRIANKSYKTEHSIDSLYFNEKI